MLEYGVTQFVNLNMKQCGQFSLVQGRTQLYGMNEAYIIIYDTMLQTLDNYQNNYS
jgi:hypothetical protein